MTRKWFLSLLAVTAMLLESCTVGPNYRRPSVPVPSAYRDSSGTVASGPQAESFADLPWWQVFEDPQVQDLIRAALKNNYDIRIAAERVNEARAQLSITRSNQLPQIQGTADFSGGQSSSTTKSNILTAVVDASYQLDLFGGLRRATEAAQAQLLSTAEAHQVVVLTVISDVATDYFQLLGLDLQLKLTLDTIGAQQESLKLTQLRAARGVASKVDVLQAQEVLDTANAQIPDIERLIKQTENAINILLGNYPAGITRKRGLAQEPLPPDVPPGLTSDLLERRPDIRQAEQNLIAANAEIGVAKAAFFPQISLGGSAGGSIGHTSFLGTGLSANSGLWSYGAGLTEPVFTAGRLRSNLRLAESRECELLIAYKQIVQKAFGEVSDAFIGYQKIREVRARQERSVRTLQEAVSISELRYRGGITTFLEVLDSQRSLYSAQLGLARARTSEYQSLVTLYKVLAGGWQR